MSNQSINLNLIPDGIAEIAKVSQFDVGRVITFHIYQGSEAYTPASGTHVEFHGMKGDNKIFIYTDTDESGAVSLSGSTITVTTTQQMTAAAGDALCQFRLVKNNNTIGTLNFTLFVQRDPSAEGDISDSELPSIIAQATEQMQRAEAAAVAAAEDAASAGNAKTGAETAQGKAEDAQTTAEAARDRAETAADKAEAAELNPPYIGANGNWFVYDIATAQYVDSGVDASITVQIADVTMLATGATPYVTNTGTATDPIFHLFIPLGVGISGITKTSTSGLVDTYTITFTDGSTTTFTVTNGADGADGDDGRGIVSITKTGTVGLVDTYTITYTDGTTSTFDVTNGADGSGNVSSVNNILPVAGNVTLNIGDLNDVVLSNVTAGQVLVYDSVSGKWVNQNQTGGHTIENASGTAMTQRDSLQFVGAEVTDDSANNRTVVSITSGAGGSTITVTTEETTLYGETVTATAGTYSKTATFNNSGVAIISGFTATGTVTITASDGEKTATANINVPYFGAYEAALSFEVIKIYGFHLDGTKSDPAQMISYEVQYDGENVDNYSYAPAAVNLSTGVMNPGDWNLTDDFFIPRSCMLKYDGTVDYYLDENDETKKEDGITASDVANTNYAGNAMMEWGRDGQKIWMKIVPDSTPTNGATFYVSNKQLDNDFHAWPFYDCDGNPTDHFYTAKYNGSVVSGKLRSISGQAPCNNQQGSTEVTYATANNVNNKTEWYTEVLADRQLINVLLLMIGKNCNTQAVFGQGYTTGGSSASSLANSGTLNGKGQWYGSSTNNDKTKGVKVFGMEHWWGNIWRRLAGYLNISGTVKYKLTHSQVDGTTQTGYDATGSGYKTVSNGTPGGTNGGYSNAAVFNADGLFPKTASGSETTYYCDGLWFNNGQSNYAIVGGGCSNGSRCGALCVNLNTAFSCAHWGIGAALSCKPLAA